MKLTYEIPVVNPTKHKEAFLRSLTRKYPKMVQWFLTVFEKEGLDFRNMGLNGARTAVKELCYPTSKCESKYNCKGAVDFPHSHYYDTAITEAIQKWNSFLTWKEKRNIKKKFPAISSYAPSFDMFMFDLDLDNGWVTLRTGRGEENVHIPVVVPNKSHYQGLDEEDITSIRLKEKENGFVFLLNHKSPSPKPPSPKELGEQSLVMGVDLGERNLASLVVIRPDCQQPEIEYVEFFDGADIKEAAHREHHIRRRLQDEGKSKEIPRRRWSEQRKKKAISEQIAAKVRRIAERFNVKVAVVGDLSAPKPRGLGSLSRRLSGYPFDKLKEAIGRHLKKSGVFVKPVYKGRTNDEPGTSQRCHRCGSKGQRYKGGFACPVCGLKDYNADLNASVNIAERGMKSLGMSGGLGAVP